MYVNESHFYFTVSVSHWFLWLKAFIKEHIYIYLFNVNTLERDGMIAVKGFVERQYLQGSGFILYTAVEDRQ